MPFNGATAEEPWSAGGDPVIELLRGIASTGPRLRSRGQVRSTGVSRVGRMGFNGATAEEPWSGRLWCGVTSFQALLQRGHG